MSNVNVTVRVDKELKEQADTLFSMLGLSLSAAVNVFLRQAVREQEFPFLPSVREYEVPNAETIEAMLETERLMKDPNVKGYDDLDEMFAELKK